MSACSIHVLALSGGKDSVATLLEVIDRNLPLDEIIYVGTGVDFPATPDFLTHVEAITQVSITRLQLKRDWDYWFYSPSRRSADLARDPVPILGFPLTLYPWCNSRLLRQPFRLYLRERYPDIPPRAILTYVGMCANEHARATSFLKHARTPHRLPLHEFGLTEVDARERCRRADLLHPCYEHFNRLGCYVCPKQSLHSLRQLWSYYPDLWVSLRKYILDSPLPFRRHPIAVDELEARFRAGRYAHSGPHGSPSRLRGSDLYDVL